MNIPTSASPNIFLFPQSLVAGLSTSALHDKAYSPTELLASIIGNPRAVDYVGSILVTQAYYYKAQTGAEHEFLVFRVSDGKLHNYLKLDRFPRHPLPEYPKSVHTKSTKDNESTLSGQSSRAEPKLNVVSFPTASSNSSGSRNLFGDHKADDLIRVSSSGRRDQLIKDCPNSEALATLTVPSETRFTLEELLTLAAVVSDYRPNYHLFESQCYWYAFTVWHLMKALYPSFVQSPTTLNNAGTHSKIPWIEWHTREGPSTDAPTQVRADVENYNLTLVPLHREAWGKFQADLPVFKQAGEQAQIELAQRAKNEARRAEEASLRAENEARRAENEARRAEEASLRANQEAKLKEQAGEEVARLQRRVLELEHQLGSGDCP